MSDDDRRRDGSKPSFSELDKRRRERHRGDGERPRGSSTARQRAAKSYRAALEKAFEEGRVEEFAATLARASEKRLPSPPSAPPDAPVEPRAPAIPRVSREELAEEEKQRAEVRKAKDRRRQLARKIHEASTPDEVTEAVDRYLSAHGGLPPDFELLEKALRHRSPEVVLQALRDLEACLVSKKPRRSRSLSMSLALLEDTHDDDEVCALAARLRRAL